MTTQEMVKLHNDGATYQEIADACGISRQAVQQRLKRSGHTLKRSGHTASEYFQQDITFCSNRECKRKKCGRHHSHADWTVKPHHSFADFTNTQYCPKRKDDVER